MGVGAGAAGASSGDANRRAHGAVIAGSYPVRAGTYEWYFNGSVDGTITLSLGNTFTIASFDDSGTWVQAGNAVGLAITGGPDALAGCVFAGKVQEVGTAISSAAKPGDFACPGYQEDGTFYIAPDSARPGAAPAHRSALVRSAAAAQSDGSFVLGTYRWTEDDSDRGRITIASGNTYTSTLRGGDSGDWVQGGKTFAFNIAGGTDDKGGCLEVGEVNATGTAVGTTAEPGNFVCPAFGTNGFFTIS